MIVSVVNHVNSARLCQLTLKLLGHDICQLQKSDIIPIQISALRDLIHSEYLLQFGRIQMFLLSYFQQLVRFVWNISKCHVPGG